MLLKYRDKPDETEERKEQYRTRKILTEEEYQRRVDQAADDYLLGKAIWPVDVANTALWLIEGATHMTGEAVRLDVGRHLQ